MALQIKVQTSTAEGFSANKAFIFLDFYFLRGNEFVNLTYYSSKANFKAGKNSYLPQGLPTAVNLKISNSAFWGQTLVSDIHSVVKAELEKVVGAGNVEIIQDPNS